MSQDLPPPPPARIPPPPVPPPLPPEGGDPARYTESGAGALNALIPAKNPHALWAYYLGIFSLFPCLGILMGIAAVILGAAAIKRFKANPAIRGRTHAIVGIVAGVLGPVIQIGIAIAIASIGAGH